MAGYYQRRVDKMRATGPEEGEARLALFPKDGNGGQESIEIKCLIPFGYQDT
jgi:hypothetical protein